MSTTPNYLNDPSVNPTTIYRPGTGPGTGMGNYGQQYMAQQAATPTAQSFQITNPKYDPNNPYSSEPPTIADPNGGAKPTVIGAGTAGWGATTGIMNPYGLDWNKIAQHGGDAVLSGVVPGAGGPGSWGYQAPPTPPPATPAATPPPATTPPPPPNAVDPNSNWSPQNGGHPMMNRFLRPSGQGINGYRPGGVTDAQPGVDQNYTSNDPNPKPGGGNQVANGGGIGLSKLTPTAGQAPTFTRYDPATGRSYFSDGTSVGNSPNGLQHFDASGNPVGSGGGNQSPYQTGVTSSHLDENGQLVYDQTNPYQFGTKEAGQNIASRYGGTAYGDQLAGPGMGWSSPQQMVRFGNGNTINAGLASQALGRPEYGGGAPGSYGDYLVSRDVNGVYGGGYDQWARSQPGFKENPRLANTGPGVGNQYMQQQPQQSPYQQSQPQQVSPYQQQGGQNYNGGGNQQARNPWTGGDSMGGAYQPSNQQRQWYNNGGGGQPNYSNYMSGQQWGGSGGGYNSNPYNGGSGGGYNSGSYQQGANQPYRVQGQSPYGNNGGGNNNGGGQQGGGGNWRPYKPAGGALSANAL